jgi:hypothetical protein
LVTAKQHNFTPEGTKLVCDIEVTTGKIIENVPIYNELTGCSMLGSKKKDSLLVSALKTTLRRLRNERTTHTKDLLAAFYASHPQIDPVNQELLIALGRYTFLLEAKAKTKNLQDGNLVNFDWLSIESIASCSPSEISLRNWTSQLAVEQYIDLQSTCAAVHW